MRVLKFLAFATFVTYALAACSSVEVRKEWRAFTSDEQTAWITAVKCMAKLPHNDSLVATVGEFAAVANITSNSSYYDDYAYVHSDLNPTIHFTGLFFPFHRYFVWSYNQALKRDCGYAGVAPYWDWTIDSSNVLNATLWSDDTSYGLGQSLGDSTDDFVVSTGGFSSDFTLAYPSIHGLRRNFTLRPWTAFASLTEYFPYPELEANSTFTTSKIDAIISNYTGDFKSFQAAVEYFEGPHSAVHEIMGGDLGGYCPENANAVCFEDEPSPTFSANEPLFWLHHGMIDRIWWKWQNANADNLNAFHGGSVQNLSYYDEFPNGSPPWLSMDSVLPNDGILLPAQTTLGDVWITEGDLLCYTYES